VAATANSLAKRDASGSSVFTEVVAGEASVDSVTYLATALIKRGAGDALLITGSGLYLDGAGSRGAGGGSNIGMGFNALGGLSTGSSNIAIGPSAGAAISGNIGNVLLGTATGDAIATGNRNAALGFDALGALTSGDDNIALGASAGTSLTSGSDNIYIGSGGASSETGVIRIGGTSQDTAFLAGVRSTAVSLGGVQVFIGNDGQLGIVVSTADTKHDVVDAKAYLDRLAELRPVRFRYRDDPSGEVQFGLIAEEVERAFPELASRDARGRLQSVRYHLLAPLVLAQAQANRVEAERLRDRLAETESRLRELELRLSALEGGGGEGR
jgi:hypothetical protein